MLSMTGFGQAARSIEEMDVTVEVKTVNSRYLDFNPRLPKELGFLEASIRQHVQAKLSRGRVELYIGFTIKSSEQYELNEPLVQNYLSVAEKVHRLGIKGTLDVSTVLQLPGALVPRQADFSSDRILENILAAAREALEKVVASRRAEGAALKADIEARLARLEELTEAIGSRAAEVGEYYRDKLTRRVQELTSKPVVDENRLAQEVIYYAERSEISEEITRLRSHVEQFQANLVNSRDEAIGRRLDFLCQEMGREMNTILSKSALPAISELAVVGKAEIEKIREQIQNVE